MAVVMNTPFVDNIILPHNFAVEKKHFLVSEIGIKTSGSIENTEVGEVSADVLMQLLLSGNATCEMVKCCIAEEVRAGKTVSESISQTDFMGRQPLLIAAQRNTLGAVEALVEMGADVECKDPASGWTPLMHAVVNGSEQIVGLLLAKNAEVNKFAKDDWSPMSAGILSNRQVIVTMLLNSGACMQILKKRHSFAHEQYLQAEKAHAYGMRRSSCHMLPSGNQYGMRRSSCSQLPF